MPGGSNKSKEDLWSYLQEQWYQVLGEETVMTGENSRKRYAQLRARSTETKWFCHKAEDIEQKLTIQPIWPNSASLLYFSYLGAYIFLNSYILNGYISISMKSLILSFSPQGLQYLPTNP